MSSVVSNLVFVFAIIVNRKSDLQASVCKNNYRIISSVSQQDLEIFINLPCSLK